MPKFRKKPFVITAEQRWPGKSVDGVEFVRQQVPIFDQFDDPWAFVHVVKTLEGDMLVSPGDWIITGINGEKYPCKDEIFRATYEEVDENE